MKSLESRTKELALKDKKHIWHPFTQMQDWQSEEILIIEKGEGNYLIDTEGKRYLDGVSSLWCNVHGHRVPEIDDAIRDQLSKIAHSTFLGLSNVPAIELGEKLVEIAPRGLSRVFYSDSGSEAVEIALKMAYQYCQQKGYKAKKKFVKLTQSYHGDTIGSVSIGGIDLFHQMYEPLLFGTYSVEAPYRYRWPGTDDPQKVMEASLEQLESVLARHHEELVAFVMEPRMQGAAGMIDQPHGYIRRVRELTAKHNVLLICDEVATGFGRTGTMFACDSEGVTPDILTAAKGLTGGYLPLAATLTTEEIYEGFLGSYAEMKTFFHGHTFTGNPLAASAALANLKLFETRGTIEALQPKIEILKERFARFYDLKAAGDIRQAGFMAGIELVRDKKTKDSYPWEEKIGVRVIMKAREKGAILRPLGPVIVLMPPLSIEEGELHKLLDITYESIKEVTEK